MRTFVAMTALAAILAVPVFVASQPAQAQTYSKEQSAPQKVKKTKVQNTKAQNAKAQKRVVHSGSPYSTNPAHDVYVNGVYVGSDPDWRIRQTLKREYCAESIDGC